MAQVKTICPECKCEHSLKITSAWAECLNCGFFQHFRKSYLISILPK